MIFIKLISFVLICFFSKKACSQAYFSEAELRQKLKTLTTDTAKARLLMRFCTVNKTNPDTTLKFALVALKLAEKEKKPGELLLNAYEVTGDAYWFCRVFTRASEYYFKELELAEKLDMKRYKGRAYYNIGWMKCIQQSSFKDRNYLIHALKIFESIKDTLSILEVYNALSGMYNGVSNAKNNYADSANIYFRNLVFFSEAHSKVYNVTIHANYANFLIGKKKYAEAKTYLDRCCKEALLINDTASYAAANKSLGNIYLATDSVEKAKKIYLEMIPLLKRTGQIEALANSYYNMTTILSYEKKYKEALENHMQYTILVDSIRKNVFETDLNEKESAYEIEKRENNIKKLEHLNEVSELKNKQNKYVISGLLLIGLLIIVVAVNLFKSNKVKQKANKDLNEKNILIEEQKKSVEEKNLDITNSINYAKRIQEAILPAKELKYELFPDAFVLFQPKDIVSGDFYWFTEKNGKKIIAAIDCTGHGVPGAFMSMIGNTFLHEAVNEKGITNPGLILNELRNNVILSLKQTDVIDSTKDGMDMALLSFDNAGNRVEFAGANNPLWLIRDGICIEFKGDKRPIGYFRGKGLPFTNNIIDLEKGDLLYIFTDGYADQFGGPSGKKLKYKQLCEHLLSIQDLSMAEQESFLIKKFNEWKGNLEQVDDVCIIGIRV